MSTSHAIRQRTGAQAPLALPTSQAPASAIGPRIAVGPLDEATKAEVDKLSRRGVSFDVLATQFGRTRASIVKAATEMRARRARETKLEFMPHPSFDDPRAQPEILAEMPAAEPGKAPRKVRARKGCPPTSPTCTTPCS